MFELEGFEITGLLGKITRDHSDGLQQSDPRAGRVVLGADQGGGEQARYRSEGGPKVDDLGECVEGAARGAERGERTKGLLVERPDHPVAPLDGGVQGLPPLRVAGQRQPQYLIEMVQKCPGWQ